MMSEVPTVETPKKVRSVRFNDNALETTVLYTADEVEGDQYNNCHPEAFEYKFDELCIDDAVRSYRRSGSHESLYDKISIEGASMNPKLLKKRCSDLDDSNHFSSSSHSCRNAQFDIGMMSSRSASNSDNSSRSSWHSRYDDNDLDISRHDRQQRHYSKRVMCV